VGIEPFSLRAAETQLTSNALTTGTLSNATQIVLGQTDLLTTWQQAPESALAHLHGIAVAPAAATPSGPAPDMLFALAEMSFLHAHKTGQRSYYLASVVYTNAFLFPVAADKRPSPFDPRQRIAADINNLALAQGLAATESPRPGDVTVAEDQPRVAVRAGTFALPFGSLAIGLDEQELLWSGRRMTGFIPAADYDVYGLRERYRHAGIGTALAADLETPQGVRGFQVAGKLKVPVTAVLQLDLSTPALASGHLTGQLHLYPADEAHSITINGQTVPLEADPSLALAYTLRNPDIWKSELRGFFSGDFTATVPSQLMSLEPYKPGRIPVVLIHGTASSAGRWADMINDLQNDPAIHDRFQLWLFTYDTGNPVPLSASQLRTSLQETVARLDPDNRDPALRRMVLIGHSQGGLLAKMLAIDPGASLYDAVSAVPLAQLDVSDDTRETIRQAFFVSRMPEVDRVIFIATPHQGSFLAATSVAQWIGQLVTLPLQVTRMLGEVVSKNAAALKIDQRAMRFGSIFSMTPGSPFITTLSATPVDPAVPAHSIIAVAGDGPVLDSDDGVVKYQSAHITEAASELTVRSGHSVQGNPQTIAEVRRILLLHWQENCPNGCLTRPDTETAPAVTADASPTANRVRKKRVLQPQPPQAQAAGG